MNLGEFLQEKREKIELDRNTLAKKLNVSYSKLQNIEKSYKGFSLSINTLEQLKVILRLNKIDRDLLDTLYRYEKEYQVGDSKKELDKVVELILLKNDEILLKSPFIKDAAYDYLLKKTLDQYNGYINDYTPLMWAIKLNIPELVEKIFYLSDEIFLKRKNLKRESCISLLQIQEQEDFDKIKNIIIDYTNKLRDIELEELKGLMKYEEIKKGKLPVYKIQTIFKNEIEKVIIDYVKIPDYIRDLDGIEVYVIDHNFHYFREYILSGEFIPQLKHDSYSFVQRGINFTNGVGSFLLIYKDKIFPSIIQEKDNYYEVLTTVKDMKNIKIQKNSAEYKILGPIVYIDEHYR